MSTLKNEIKSQGLNKEVKNLLKAQKESIKGIFALHRNSLDLLVLDNKDYFDFIQVDGKINPTITEMKKDKTFKPFHLLYGCAT